jgi:hypothetical protein
MTVFKQNEILLVREQTRDYISPRVPAPRLKPKKIIYRAKLKKNLGKNEVELRMAYSYPNNYPAGFPHPPRRLRTGQS